jgi:hypothetical protein
MLLNEFLKEHRTVKRLQASFGQQQKHFQSKPASLQKASAQVEMSRLAPQMVLNNQ